MIVDQNGKNYEKSRSSQGFPHSLIVFIGLLPHGVGNSESVATAIRKLAESRCSPSWAYILLAICLRSITRPTSIYRSSWADACARLDLPLGFPS